LVVKADMDLCVDMGHSMNNPRPYCKIVINGTLNERWSDYLGDMLVILDVKTGQVKNTTLIGRPRDLTIYTGMLNALANLGLTVITAEYRQPGTNTGVERVPGEGQWVNNSPRG
jgi:hypothetical protein